MATLCGLRRRGYPPEAIRDFCEKIGVSKAFSVIDYSLLEACIRDNLNQNAPRAMAVLRPVKLVVDNYPAGKTEEITVEVNPNRPGDGTRKTVFSREIFIEADDYSENPPKGYFRLTPGLEVRLKGAYVVKCTGADKDENGRILAVHCTYDPETAGGNTPDGRKVKGTIHWVSAENAADCEIRLYSRLFLTENPSGEEAGEDFTANLNPDSLEILTGCKLEKQLLWAKAGDTFQFMRQGYFCADPDSSGGACPRPVFNRTVALKDSFAGKK
jgi:glutaminyl-tRNA synthetase